MDKEIFEEFVKNNCPNKRKPSQTCDVCTLKVKACEIECRVYSANRHLGIPQHFKHKCVPCNKVLFDGGRKHDRLRWDPQYLATRQQKTDEVAK